MSSSNWWGGYSGSDWRYSDSSGDSSTKSKSSKTKHKFSPILLIYTTVYNCELCGEKKEDCTTDYCKIEDNDWDNPGGW